MEKIVRKLAALPVGFLATLFISFAVPAQTPVVEAVKGSDRIASLSERWARSISVKPSADAAKYPVSLFAPRPRGCFCDEDCFEALLKKERALRHFRDWGRPLLTPDPEIRQVDLEGLKKLLQPDTKDARPLLVNFWATWCDPCREEFPDLVKIDTDYRAKNLNFVTVSLDDVSEIATEVPKFLKLMKATMPTVLLNVNDPEPAIKSVDAGWDGQLPATFLYDKDGKIVFRHFGKIKPDELRAAIDKALGSKQ